MGPGAILICFYCGGSPLIVIDHDHCMYHPGDQSPLFHLLLLRPKMDLYNTPRGSLQVKSNPGLDRLDAVFNHAQDTK